MTWNGQFRLICNFSNLFPLKWLRMIQNSQFHLIRNFSNLFPPKWLRMTQNSQFCLIHNFSNLFPPKWLRMTQNSQFCPICNFSNFFPPKWLRMTWNGQFCIAKIKYTLIQGNFYERLLFYMDSCALSPMASLLFLSSTHAKWATLFAFSSFKIKGSIASPSTSLLINRFHLCMLQSLVFQIYLPTTSIMYNLCCTEAYPTWMLIKSDNPM